MLQGAKKLFTINPGPLAGVFGLSILVIIVLGVVIGLLSAGLLSALLQAQTQPLGTQTEISTLNISGGVIAGGLVIFVVFLFVASFFTAMQNKLLAVSSLGQKIGFGELFKLSLSRTMPMLGQFGLLLLAFAAIGLLFVLFMGVPVLNFLVLFAGMVGMFYMIIRLVYAGLVLANESLGPVQSLKRSWQLTQGRFGETMGAVFAATIIFGLPFALLEGIVSATGNAGLALLAALLNAAAGVALMAGVAARYVQHRQLADSGQPKPKTHLLNYFSPLIFIGAAIILGMFLPAQPTTTPDNSLENYLNSSQSSDSTEDTDASLEEYLREQGVDPSEFQSDSSSDYNLN